MAKNIKAITTEVASTHLAMFARPEEATKLINRGNDVEAILGRPARPIETMVRENRKKFGEG